METKLNRKRTHHEMSSCDDYPRRDKCQIKDIVELIEEGKTELEKIKIGFRDPNKLGLVKEYLNSKADHNDHLTIEIKVFEKQMMQEKNGKYHCIYKIHLKAIDLPAYLYFIHPEAELITEGEVYVLKNVNCVIYNNDAFIMIKSNQSTELILLNDDTMSIGSFDENEGSNSKSKSTPMSTELVIKKPFHKWKECRSITFRNYGDILSNINRHVDLRQIKLIQHVLICVVPSLIKPIKTIQTKMQSKLYKTYTYEHLNMIKDTQVSFIGIIKNKINVSLILI